MFTSVLSKLTSKDKILFSSIFLWGLLHKSSLTNLYLFLSTGFFHSQIILYGCDSKWKKVDTRLKEIWDIAREGLGKKDEKENEKFEPFNNYMIVNVWENKDNNS